MMRFMCVGLELSAKMKLALLCLCLASTASAAPVRWVGLLSLSGNHILSLQEKLVPWDLSFVSIVSVFVFVFSRHFTTCLITQDPDNSCHLHRYSKGLPQLCRYRPASEWNLLTFHHVDYLTSTQMKNPFAAAPPPPQTPMPGAYSVELVCHSSSYFLFRLHLKYLSCCDDDLRSEWPTLTLVCVVFKALSPQLRRSWWHGEQTHNSEPYPLVVKHYTTVHYFPMIFLQTHGFVKYSIPQPPGRQSVELVSCLLL